MPLLPVITRHDDRTAWNTRTVAATLAMVTAAVFLPAVRCGFVNWDDNQYVSENPTVVGPLDGAAVWRACTGSFVENWSPLTMLSYQFDALVFGTNAWGFHLTNVLLHAAATALLFVALNSLTAATGRSAAVALLFGIHPLRVESVAWVSERKDVLCVLFLMLSLLAYDKYCRRPSIGRFGCVAVTMLASLLSKPMLVTLPVLLLLVDAWPMRRLPGEERGLPASSMPRYPPASWRRIAIEKGLLSVLAAIFVGVTLVTQSKAMADDSLPLLTQRVPNALHAAVWYVWKTFVPTGLHAYHPHVGATLSTSTILTLGIAIAVPLGIAIACRKHEPAVLWGLCWYGVSLLPVIGLVQVGTQGLAERYTYVPHVGLLVAIVWCMADAASRYRLPNLLLPTVCVAAAVAAASCSVFQIDTWRDSPTLWRHCLQHEPNAAVPHYNYGCALDETGDHDQAFAEYRRALECDPCHVGALDNLAAILIERQQFADARPFVGKALAVEPEPLTHINHARLLLAEQRPREALAAARLAADLGPDDPAALFMLGRVAAVNGDASTAIDAYRQAIRLDPGHMAARNNLATTLARRGDLPAAIAEFRAILAISPDSAAVRKNLSLALEQAGQRELPGSADAPLGSRRSDE